MIQKTQTVMFLKLRKLLALLALALGSGAAMSTPTVMFLIDGDTFADDFKITNLSSSESITGITLTLPVNFVFDTTGTTANQGRYIADTNNTGYLDASVPGPADSSTSVSFQFNGFVPNVDEYWWVLDVDGSNAASSGSDLTVNGNMLIGATVAVSFDDGSTLTGTLGQCSLFFCPRGKGAMWTASGTTVPPGTGVPEPGSLALAGLALLAAGLMRRTP